MKLSELIITEGMEHISFWIDTNSSELIQSHEPHVMIVAKSPERFGIDPSTIPQPVDWDNPDYEEWHIENDNKFGPLYTFLYRKGWIRGYYSEFGSKSFDKELGFSASRFLLKTNQQTITRLIQKYKPNKVFFDFSPTQALKFEIPKNINMMNRIVFGQNT